jgi:hypothetical protein
VRGSTGVAVRLKQSLGRLSLPLASAAGGIELSTILSHLKFGYSAMANATHWMDFDKLNLFSLVSAFINE